MQDCNCMLLVLTFISSFSLCLDSIPRVCLYSVPCQAPAQSKDTDGRGVELKGSSNKKNGGAGGGGKGGGGGCCN